MIIGVLGLQGAFIEHVNILNRINGCTAIIVKTVEELLTVDALILPGGESTAIMKLAQDSGLVDPLVKFIKDDRPVWGTCAGLILLSNTVSASSIADNQSTLGGLDITIERNAFGTQSDSFIQQITIDGMDATFPGIFIRAPVVAEVRDDSIKILATVSRKEKEMIVALRKGNILGTSFHPELTQDLRFHQLFVDMVKEYKQQ